MVLQPTRRRFTVSEYHRMAEAGIFGEDDRIELIDGEVTEMTPIRRRHAGCANRLTKLLERALGDVGIVSVQNPVDVSEDSEPQPDLALLRPQPDFYTSGHPTSQDVLMLIEVSDSTAELDRRVKAPPYARSGIPEVWLVDVEQEIAIHRDPSATGYRTARVARRGEAISPAAFPDRLLAVADIL